MSSNTDNRKAKDRVLLPQRLAAQVANRRSRHLNRTLTDLSALAIPATHDFASNDYMGLARALSTATPSQHPHGSTGSRLLSGHSPLATTVEHSLAALHSSPAALLFNSGYVANLSVFSALASPGDLLLLDELVHASVWDAARMAVGRWAMRGNPEAVQVRTFKHGNVSDMCRAIGEYRAANAKGAVMVAVEAIYSMDGTVVPLREMVDAVGRWEDVWFIVDEAHSSGVVGEAGTGVVKALGLETEERVLVRVHTFGKAVGCHGAVAFCSNDVREYLLNYARPLIYSTMMAPAAVQAISDSYAYLVKHHAQLSSNLSAIIAHFRSTASSYSLPLVPSSTHIQGILIPGNQRVVRIARELLNRGMYTLPIRSPTVAPGAERIRICLHAYNSMVAVDDLCLAVKDLLLSEQEQDIKAKRDANVVVAKL
ncbi:pyridoxal phosphate-dependent transferase [Catenaria anguillulae PL171]|uniref:Pyridoxal phosphate-dependent transferase n=1 Tax=Catenaria anguillulae PL171 TaxID=765915 RepID=A0A1Y2H743_9FUNG|nr:pyridoxal phosphate-dependent transferase [Catenaria anguillulae PL171]